MTTLSQTGSLFKPSSAYLPHELLGKVSRVFFFFFFPLFHIRKQIKILVLELYVGPKIAGFL